MQTSRNVQGIVKHADFKKRSDIKKQSDNEKKIDVDKQTILGQIRY